MKTWTWLLVATMASAALIAGEYLSGMLLMLFAGRNVSDAHWTTYLSYIRALDLPQVHAHLTKIKWAGLLGFGVPIALFLASLMPIFRRKKRAIHGDARFATNADLRKHGMFKPSKRGILIGKRGRKKLWLDGQQFVILAAPTRSGKGVSAVVPNLLYYPESMVALDIKQENFDLTSGWRASQGQEIYLFNPFAEDLRTHRWNPIGNIPSDPIFRVPELASIAAAFYPDGTADQKFWVSEARNAFMAFTLFLFEQWDSDERTGVPQELRTKPTLGAVYRVSSGDGSDLRASYERMARMDFLSSDARTAFANVLSHAEETFSSVLGAFKEPLNAWINPILDAATSENDFQLADVRRKKMTIYVGIQPNKLAESRLIVNLFFNQLINANTKELPEKNPELKYQCVLLMDEFTAIGKVEIIASAIAYIAGYNMRLVPIIQSMSQLNAVYGADNARTIVTNHALQIIFAPREQQDASDYSEMLGYGTVRRESVTRGRGRSDVSRSHSEERRALLLPQELKAMGANKEIFLYEGIPHPVMCDKIVYYKDRYFTSRLLPKVEIPSLKIRN